jgi:hypothetical protein
LRSGGRNDLGAFGLGATGGRARVGEWKDARGHVGQSAVTQTAPKLSRVCITADSVEKMRRAARLGFSWPRSFPDRIGRLRSICVGPIEMPLEKKAGAEDGYRGLVLEGWRQGEKGMDIGGEGRGRAVSLFMNQYKWDGTKGISNGPTHSGTKSGSFVTVCVRPQTGLGLCPPPLSVSVEHSPSGPTHLAAGAFF